MRKFLLVLLALMLLFSSASAGTINFNLEDMLIEHRVFLTDDTDTYLEVIVLFYGHDTHKVYQINDEILFDKRAGYTVSSFSSLNPEEYYPGFNKLNFASFSVEEQPKAISVLFSFSKLNDPSNFKQAVQNGILTGSYPNNSVDVDSLAKTIQGRELTMLEYGEIGLHFDVK